MKIAVGCLGLALFTFGCETFTPPVQIKSVDGQTDAVTMNANRRGVYFLTVDGRTTMVAEPPPDTALASTVNSLGKISADIARKSGEAEAKLDVTQALTQIARASSVTILRDTLFRLSEAWANGTIDSAQYQAMHADVVEAVTELAMAETKREQQIAAQRYAEAFAARAKLASQALNVMRENRENDARVESLLRAIGDVPLPPPPDAG